MYIYRENIKNCARDKAAGDGFRMNFISFRTSPITMSTRNERARIYATAKRKPHCTARISATLVHNH